jgi:YihY family inner membrane protein
VSWTDLPERGVRWFDDRQQDRRWLAQPIGTIRKYADDRGSAFAGLVTFQIFLGMLPLLVVALTVLSRVVGDSEQLKDAVLDSALGQFPVLGSRIEEDIDTIAATGPWLWITIAGLLWTSAGIYHGMQLAMNQVWNVRGVHRQGFVSRHVRAAILFVLVFAAAIGTSALQGTPLVGWGPTWLATVWSLLLGAAIAGLLLLGVFRIVTAPVIPTRDLVPAAVAAGVAWELLQRLGTWVVLDRLSEAQDLYGTIGFVVVVLFWINLLARSAVLANEMAVVWRRGLWPRRIAQPPLTEADRRVLEGLVGNEHRRPEQHIEVTWDDDQPHQDQVQGQGHGPGDVSADGDLDEDGSVRNGRADHAARA